MKKVVLIGYMGSGKSAISKKIANLINIPFVELDDYIEEKEGMSIENIFKKKGELYFRKIEHQLFLELLDSKESLIISTGIISVLVFIGILIFNKVEKSFMDTV